MNPKEITPIDLNNWITGDSKIKPILIDVRELWEHEIVNLKQAELIPMGNIPLKINSLINTKPYVIFCHHGMRSMKVALFLTQNGFSQIFNLTGGIEGWRQTVDPTLSAY